LRLAFVVATLLPLATACDNRTAQTGATSTGPYADELPPAPTAASPDTPVEDLSDRCSRQAHPALQALRDPTLATTARVDVTLDHTACAVLTDLLDRWTWSTNVDTTDACPNHATVAVGTTALEIATRPQILDQIARNPATPIGIAEGSTTNSRGDTRHMAVLIIC